MHDRSTPKLQISLLGPWRMEVAGHPVPNSAWKSKKALSLFRYLITHRQQKTHKDVLLNLFWPDEDPEDASGRLHTTVYFVRRMIQPDRSAHDGASYIRFGDGMYWFEAEDTWIDVDEFLSCFDQGVALEATDPERALEYYRKALVLYRGDFLPEEAYADWTEPRRSELRELFVTLSLRASYLLARQPGGASEAVRICRAALNLEPFREELHQAIMAHLIGAGRYGEAAAQYRQLTTMLKREFDLPPSPETRALFEQMQATHQNRRQEAAGSDERAVAKPLLCTQETFDVVTELARRWHRRDGLPFSQITLTLRTPSDAVIAGVVDRLQRVLRQSDLLCVQKDGVQLLLLHTGKEGCNIVKRRIARALLQDGMSQVRIHSNTFEYQTRQREAVNQR